MKQIIKLGLKWVSETEETRTPKVERNVSLPGSLSILLFKPTLHNSDKGIHFIRG